MDWNTTLVEMDDLGSVSSQRNLNEETELQLK